MHLTPLNYRKEFDAMAHPILLQILVGSGIRDIVLDIYRNYLLNWQQRVRTDDTVSDLLVVQYGVPQGTGISIGSI